MNKKQVISQIHELQASSEKGTFMRIGSTLLMFCNEPVFYDDKICHESFSVRQVFNPNENMDIIDANLGMVFLPTIERMKELFEVYYENTIYPLLYQINFAMKELQRI